MYSEQPDSTIAAENCSTSPADTVKLCNWVSSILVSAATCETICSMSGHRSGQGCLQVRSTQPKQTRRHVKANGALLSKKLNYNVSPITPSKQD